MNRKPQPDAAGTPVPGEDVGARAAANTSGATNPPTDLRSRLVGLLRQGGVRAADFWQRRARGTGVQTVRGRLGPRFVALALVALALSSLALGTLGSFAVLSAIDAQAVARDASSQLSAIETLLKDSGYLRADHLSAAQSHLQALDVDVSRLRHNGLLNPSLAYLDGTDGIVHLLAMAADLIDAANDGIDAGELLVPHLGDLFHGLTGDAQTASSQPPPLTSAALARATADLTMAGRSARLALQERSYVHDSDVQKIGFGSLVPRLHTVDSLAPQLLTDLDQAQVIAASLPALLGMQTPAHYLLLDLDSDELRPTGGFPGNYAIMTVSGARLQGGLELHDIYTLDCPHGCPSNPIPPEFAWMDIAPTHFGLRDATLNPDYPASSAYLEHLLTNEGGPQVDGVISITPALVVQLLQLTGPIAVPEFNRTVSAANLQDVIHYYHFLAIEQSGPSGAPYGTSDRKVIDAVLGKRLLQAVAKLSPDQQQRATSIVLDALSTRDVQVYLNNADVEHVLAQHNLAGEVYTPANGDSLFTVDANIGVTYANADVAEQLADAVTLDQHGRATHDLTITYTYNKRSHLYDGVYALAGGGWFYRDFVRVILPAGAQITGGSGCTWTPVAQADHNARGCLFVLSASQSRSLHLQWTVSGGAQVGQPGLRYELFVQRQAGNAQVAQITVKGPPGAQPTRPPSPPLTTGAAGQVTFSGTLNRSQDLVVAYSG